MEDKKKNILKMIVLALICAFVFSSLGFVGGYLFLNKEDEKVVDKNEIDIDDTTDNVNCEENIPEEEKIIYNNDSDKKGFMSVESDSFTKLLMINNEVHKLTYTMINSNEFSSYSLKFDGKNIDEVNHIQNPGIFYQVFTASDNKEYLVVYCNSWTGDLLYIVNYEGKVLKNFRFYNKDIECNYFFEEEKDMFYIEGNSLYYYAYVSSNYEENNYDIKPEVTMELTKVDINNNQVSEKGTGIKEKGLYGQCS